MIRAVGAKLDYIFIRHILLEALLHNTLLHIEKFKIEHYGKYKLGMGIVPIFSSPCYQATVKNFPWYMHMNYTECIQPMYEFFRPVVCPDVWCWHEY